MTAVTTYPGFENPVHDAQQVFRATLKALSRPGVPVAVPQLPPALPCSGMSQGLLSLALTLCDNTTSVWLDDNLNNSTVRHHLRFHCASPLTENEQKADFAFISNPLNMPSLERFSLGHNEYPERSTTLIMATTMVVGGVPSLEVTGPGVKGNETGHWLTLPSFTLPQWFLEGWKGNGARYPLGVDMVLVESRSAPSGEIKEYLWGFPRTARIRQKGQAVQVLATKENTLCM